jgi:hypothetical protein
VRVGRSLGEKTAGNNSGKNAIRGLTTEFRNWLPWIILALLGLGPLFVCMLFGPVAIGPERGLKAAPDWSRALPVGSGFYGTDSGAPLVVDDQGRVHMVWGVRRGAQEYDLRYLRLDDQGLVQEERDLNIGLYEPRKVRLILGDDGSMDLFLLALEAREKPSGLFHLRLDTDGHAVQGPTLVSSGSAPCHEYAVAVESEGTIHIFWTEGLGDERSLYYLKLPANRGEPEKVKAIGAGVSGPVARADSRDRIHLLWEEPGDDEESADLYHAVFTDGSPDISSGVKLLVLPRGVRFTRHGPVLALDDEYGYVVWTQEYRASRLAASVMEGWYASFRLESPASAPARFFSLPVEEKPKYEKYDGYCNYQYVVPWQGDAELGSERIAEPSPLASPREALVSTSMIVMRGVAGESQISNLVFADGGLVGYQLACNTARWSRLPNLTSDSEGNLHLSWVEGLEPGPSEVYYATTSPTVRSRVDHLSVDDLLSAFLNTAFASVAGAPMIPFVVAWLIPPMIWAFLISRFLGEEGVRGVRGCLALAAAVVLYQASKLYFNPGLLGYVPFSVSVPFLPVTWYDPLRTIVPPAILALGGVGVAFALFRAEVRNVVALTLIFCLIDALLTLIVYGPGLAALG